MRRRPCDNLEQGFLQKFHAAEVRDKSRAGNFYNYTTFCKQCLAVILITLTYIRIADIIIDMSKNWIPLSEIPTRDEFDANTDPFANEFRFPTDVDTGGSLLKLDRIQVNVGAIRWVNDFGCFCSSVMGEFQGGGAIYQDTVSGISADGTAIKGRSTVAKKAEPARSDLILPDGISKQVYRMGFGWPLAIHQLNRTDIGERVVDLTGRHPNEDDALNKAWALTLNHALAASIRSSGRKNLLDCGGDERSRWLGASATVSYALLTVSAPPLVPVLVGASAAVTAHTGKRLVDSGSFDSMRDAMHEARFSLLPSHVALYDRYLSLIGLTRVRNFIKYRR